VRADGILLGECLDRFSGVFMIGCRMIEEGEKGESSDWGGAERILDLSRGGGVEELGDCPFS
jgi:hypothetical protein